MPKLEAAWRYQTVILWEATAGTYDFYGNMTWSAPSEITVRLERKFEEVQGADRVIVLEAEMHSTQDIPVGSVIYEGSLETWLGSGSSGDNDKLLQVMTRDVIPDVKGRETKYEYGLAKHRDESPSS